MVILHDATLNRTMRRRKGYSVIEEPVKLKDITFHKLRSDFVLASEHSLHRTQIPSLEEFLYACRAYEITPMLDSEIPESFILAQKIMGNNWICFVSYDSLAIEVRKFSDCLILLDPGGNTDNIIERLEAIGGHCGISSMNRHILSKELCEKLRERSYEVQASIFESPHEIEARKNGVSIILTDFAIYPENEQALDNWNLTALPADKDHRNFLNGKSKTLILKPSEEIIRVWDKPIDYGAIKLNIRFKGTLDIYINDRHYAFSHSSEEDDEIGIRFAHDTPKLRFSASEVTEISNLDVRIFSF